VNAKVILPDGGRLVFPLISAGTSYRDAVFEHTATPTRFFKARITWNEVGWDLRLKDGTVYTFDSAENAPTPGRASILLLSLSASLIPRAERKSGAAGPADRLRQGCGVRRSASREGGNRTLRRLTSCSSCRRDRRALSVPRFTDRRGQHSTSASLDIQPRGHPTEQKR
jgi:hypothetical protein